MEGADERERQTPECDADALEARESAPANDERCAQRPGHCAGANSRSEEPDPGIAGIEQLNSDHDDENNAASAALVSARQKLFGVENVDEKGRVDKEKVIFSWATNTTYVASVLGRVILLDSYLTRPELPTAPIDRRYNPVLPKDLADAKPEAIFLGHGHGDHADNGAFIAKWSGATIYASAETCQVMQLDVQRMWNDPNTANGGVKMIPDANRSGGRSRSG